jgi:hypothetical protein
MAVKPKKQNITDVNAIKTCVVNNMVWKLRGKKDLKRQHVKSATFTTLYRFLFSTAFIVAF